MAIRVILRFCGKKIFTKVNEMINCNYASIPIFFQFFRPLSFFFKRRIKYRVRRQFRWKFGWVFFGDNFCWVCCQNWHWTKSNRRVSARSRRKFTAAKIPPSIGSIWWYTAILIGPTFNASYNHTKTGFLDFAFTQTLWNQKFWKI